MRLKQTGQATIEALCTAAFIATLLTASTSISYLLYAKQVSDFSLQKSLLCLETSKSTSSCKRTLETRLKQLLLFSPVKNIYLKRKTHENYASVSFNFINKTVTWSQKIKKDFGTL